MNKNKEKDIYVIIAKRIKEERKKLSLTQEELAAKSNIGTKFLSSIERCASKPSLDTFIKIARALNISCDLLTIDSNVKTDYNSNSFKPLEYAVSGFSPSQQEDVLKLIKNIKKLTVKK